MHPHSEDTDSHDRARALHPNILWMAVAVSTSFAVLYGLFVALAVVSLFLLSRRGFRRPLSAIQVFAVTVLLLSTTTHWVVVILQHFGGLLTHPDMEEKTFWASSIVEQCVGTATLTINIVVGDLVVWWRVWVLWPESRVVRISGCILLFATFVMSVVDTNFSCQEQEGFMFEGLTEGTVALVLSLASNIFATVFTAHKARVYHKVIRSHPELSGSMNRRVKHIFVLLVESGALYCALWIVVLVWQITSHCSTNIVRQIFSQHHHRASPFWTGGEVLIEGCLVPLIAIYPTVIIVLVALNRSAADSENNGFKRDVAGRPGIAVTVESVVSTHSDFEDPPLAAAGSISSFENISQTRREASDSEKMAHCSV